MKNVRIKIRESCRGSLSHGYNFGIFEGRKVLMMFTSIWSVPWKTEAAAIHNAKAMAKRIGIPYSDEIIKQHGC